MPKLPNPQLDFVWRGLLKNSEQGANPSLQSTLRMNLVQAMLDGRIPGGTRLPSTRELASLLKVARITVVLVYEALSAEGLLITRQRSGHFVPHGLTDKQKVTEILHPQLSIKPDWQAHIVPFPQGEKWLEKPRIWQNYRYPFVYGQMDTKLFPLAEWRECSRLAQATPDSSRWASDAIDVDDPFLIEQLCSRILPKRGISATPDEVLITMGSQMGAFLLSELIVGQGTQVALEDPGYMDGRNIFLRRGAQILPIRVDGEGAIPPASLQKYSCLYCTPSQQCPTGVTLSMERRIELLSLARRCQCLIIEDDYDAETQFDGHPQPSLKAMDKSGHVIYLSSLSKIFAPGLRIGYMVADRMLIERARHLRRLILRHAPTNNQRAMGLFIAHGHFERLAVRHRSSLEQRAARIAESLHRHLPAWRFKTPRSGSALWVQGPASCSMKSIEVEARKKSVLVECGDAFFHSQDPPRNFVRLAYSTIDLDLIEPGIRILAGVVREQKRHARSA
jgi:GntR family transcriptional regulator/MocR family aminotransferase